MKQLSFDWYRRCSLQAYLSSDAMGLYELVTYPIPDHDLVWKRLTNKIYPIPRESASFESLGIVHDSAFNYLDLLHSCLHEVYALFNYD